MRSFNPSLVEITIRRRQKYSKTRIQRSCFNPSLVEITIRRSWGSFGFSLSMILFQSFSSGNYDQKLGSKTAISSDQSGFQSFSSGNYDQKKLKLSQAEAGKLSFNPSLVEITIRRRDVHGVVRIVGKFQSFSSGNYDQKVDGVRAPEKSTYSFNPSLVEITIRRKVLNDRYLLQPSSFNPSLVEITIRRCSSFICF